MAAADFNGFIDAARAGRDCRDYVRQDARVKEADSNLRLQRHLAPLITASQLQFTGVGGIAMLRKKIIVTAFAAAMFASVNVRPASAQGGPVDSRTEFTFNAPVELPGVTLPPGTYVFRFADATTSRKVMQVVAKNDSNKTYGLFLTISAQRPKPSDEAELRFLETPAGKPAAVKTWWYPGNSIGREFIYPKDQARRLATATNTTVLTTKAETVPSGQMATADLVTVSPTGQEATVTEEMVNAAANTAPTSASANMNSSNTNSSNTPSMNRAQAPAQQSTSAANMNTSRRRLPRTNTMLPLIALMGLSSLAGGTIRLRR
jgi:hypothetical protein